MSQIIRTKDLSVIGFTSEDLEDRTLILTGYIKRELLPPYISRVREESAKRVLDYAKGKKVKRVKSSLHKAHIRRRFRELPKLVEVAGCMFDGCVLTTSHYLLDLGVMVLIDPKFSISSNPGLPDYWKGRITMIELLSGYKERKCLVYDKRLIFYRP